MRQTEGERGFHVLYECLARVNARRGDRWCRAWPDGRATGDAFGADSVCVNGSSCGVDGRHDGVTDDASLGERLDALAAFGVEGAARDAVLETLAAVLHLGAVTFAAVHHQTEDSGCACAGNARPRLEAAAALLGVGAPALERALTRRAVRAA